MPLRRESKRGLLALAMVVGVGVATFATLSSLTSSSTFRSHARDALATRLKQTP